MDILSKIVLGIGLFSLSGTVCVAQNGTYDVTLQEFNELQSAPKKIAEIEAQNLTIKIVEEISEPVKASVYPVTSEELSTYQSNDAKWAEFLKSTDGNYEVVEKEVKPAATQSISESDLEKLRIEEQSEAGKVKTRDRSYKQPAIREEVSVQSGSDSQPSVSTEMVQVTSSATLAKPKYSDSHANEPIIGLTDEKNASSKPDMKALDEERQGMIEARKIEKAGYLSSKSESKSNRVKSSGTSQNVDSDSKAKTK